MEKTINQASDQPAADQAKRNRGRWKLLAVLLVCAAPMIFSYLTYYVIKPSGRTNYGALIDPRAHPIPQLKATTLDGKPSGLDAYKGKWLLVRVGPSECKETCRRQLFAMRQLRTMQGKEMTRVERIWLITDTAPLDTVLMREIDGTRMLRVQADAVRKWLPVEQGGQAEQHLFMIDPLGNLMMRFPKEVIDNTDNATRAKKDIYKLLKASAIG